MIVGLLAGIVLLLPNGWRVFLWQVGIGPKPTQKLHLTKLVIPLIVLIDTVGLCFFIIHTGGASQSPFTPLLFVVPIVAIILSERRTFLPFLYFALIIVAFGVTLFLWSDVTKSFTIKNATFFNIIRLIAAIVSTILGGISYAKTQWEVTEEEQ